MGRWDSARRNERPSKWCSSRMASVEASRPHPLRYSFNSRVLSEARGLLGGGIRVSSKRSAAVSQTPGEARTGWEGSGWSMPRRDPWWWEGEEGRGGKTTEGPEVEGARFRKGGRTPGKGEGVGSWGSISWDGFFERRKGKKRGRERRLKGEGRSGMKKREEERRRDKGEEEKRLEGFGNEKSENDSGSQKRRKKRIGRRRRKGKERRKKERRQKEGCERRRRKLEQTRQTGKPRNFFKSRIKTLRETFFLGVGDYMN